MSWANKVKQSAHADQRRDQMVSMSRRTDSPGSVDVTADKLWGAQNSALVGTLITTYAMLKKPAAISSERASGSTMCCHHRLHDLRATSKLDC